MTQQQPFDVLRNLDGFQLRRYPSYVLVQAEVSSDFERSGNLGFRPLFRYITGDNAEAAKIAMTAPVIQQERSELEHTVSFVLPEGMDVASVPLPRDASVSIKNVPEHDAAAVRFSGGWSDARFRAKGVALMAAVNAAGLTAVGSVYYARFDPPWMPGFARHNEALVAVETVST
jgi:SOUL heme-binding protein